MCAEFFQFFVQSKTGRLGRNLEENATGLSEINRMKIGPIDHWRDVVAELDEMLAPLELFGFILRPERNVMYRSRRDPAHASVRQAKQINDSAGR